MVQPTGNAARSEIGVALTAPAADASEAQQAEFLAAATRCMEENGIVVLRDAIPRSVMAEALSHFNTVYEAYMRPGQERLFRNFQDDPKRAQIPVAPTGPLANPLMFANPAVMSVVRSLIGDQAIIGEMGGVISHPGSEPQYTHRDSGFLFGGRPGEVDLPPHSLTITIPLCDVALECGPTEYWPGSHRQLDSKAALAVSPQRMALRAGWLLLYDGRLLHRGGANLSDIVRPIIYITYQHPWYLERPGYANKPQIKITPTMLSRIPSQHRHLFEWALHLNRSDTFDEFLMRWLGRFRARLGPFIGGSRKSSKT